MKGFRFAAEYRKKLQKASGGVYEDWRWKPVIEFCFFKTQHLQEEEKKNDWMS